MELTDLMENLTTNQYTASESKLFKSIGAEINDVLTDFVWAEFQNCVVLIITQYQKIGSLISSLKDETCLSAIVKESTYSTKFLLGSGDIENEFAARFLADNLKIDKPLLLFSSLRDYGVEVLKAVKDICLDSFITDKS